jgi:flagellar hook-length control protein FliK
MPASGADASGSPASSEPAPTAERPATERPNAATAGTEAAAAGSLDAAAGEPVAPSTATRTEAAAGTAAASQGTTETPGDATAERMLRLSELLDAAQAAVRHQRPERVVLELHPAELGSVTVDLRLDGDQVNVLLRTTTSTGAERLGGALDQLRQALESAGVGVGDLGLDNGSNGRSARDTDPGSGSLSGRGGVGTPSSAPTAVAAAPARHAMTTSTGRLAVDL